MELQIEFYRFAYITFKATKPVQNLFQVARAARGLQEV